MSVASIASQMGVCASPASVAVVSVVAILGATDHPFGVMQILSISIPATFIGVVIAGLWSINRGKDLDKDSEFQEKIADPEQKEFIYGGLQEQSLLNIILPKKCLSGSISFSSGYRCDCYLWQLPTIIAALSQRQRRFEAVFHDTDNPADDAFYCRCHYDPVQC